MKSPPALRRGTERRDSADVAPFFCINFISVGWRYSTVKSSPPSPSPLPQADIAIIDRAASLRGRSRTDFVRETAVRAAEDVLLETAPLRMSAAGFKAFTAALSGPAAPVSEMIDLFRRAAPWETDPPKTRR